MIVFLSQVLIVVIYDLNYFDVSSCSNVERVRRKLFLGFHRFLPGGVIMKRRRRGKRERI